MEVFETCQKINAQLQIGNEVDARNQLIELLDYHNRENLEYTPLVNHLIRQTGLYPYLDTSTAIWSDRVAYDAFKSNIGTEQSVTLHREQSSILKKLLDGVSLAISAPTSFGKSFIIDAFIAIQKPRNVIIIVPTIALTDETRRRLHQKFSHLYKIITTSDAELSERNIFVFPQERVFSYVERLDSIDILIVDEFYKASPDFERDRSKALLRAILKLSDRSKQKYFLAPNISAISDNPFTNDMEFVQLDFQTVSLRTAKLYENYADLKGQDLDVEKSRLLVKIIEKHPRKTLVYAGTYKEISKIANLLISKRPSTDSKLLRDFSAWLAKNYSSGWALTKLSTRGVGVHNGRLHRALSQIQIRLFEEENGLQTIVSTSSIIEGVNTSAESVIIWHNKNGQFNLNDFTYKNIIGRGGRMFKHFIGNIYLLAPPPKSTNTQLDLSLPDSLLLDLDLEALRSDLTQEQWAKITLQKESLSDLLGEGVMDQLQRESALQISDTGLVRTIAQELKYNRQAWNGLAYLNSDNPDNWENLIYRVLNLQPGGWGIEFNRFVTFVKILRFNWKNTVPEMLRKLRSVDIGLDTFFELERNVSFKLAALLTDINTIQKHLWSDRDVDISPFIVKVSHAFLPTTVYQLEEYGLPRMISRKIQDAGIINLENTDIALHEALEQFLEIGSKELLSQIRNLDEFDKYIIDYFYRGIIRPSA